MGKCQTCRFWQRHDYRAGLLFGSCSCPKFIYPYENGRSGVENPPNDALIYEDGECDRAGFETGEGFGCIHWEAGAVVR